MRHLRIGARLRIALFCALAATLLLVPLASTGAAKRATPKTTTVEASGGPGPYSWEWSPADVTISKGEVVRWKNTTDVTHHLKSWDGPWDLSKNLDTGSTTAMRFKKPGVYRYWCDTITHADVFYVGYERICTGMCGTITVR